MTLLQLLITHLLLLLFASLTRGLEPLLSLLGLSALVAPSHAHARPGDSDRPPGRYRGGRRYRSVWRNVRDWLTHRSGGIAGGGLFEFQARSARAVAPLAGVYAARMVLSNLSYAYDMPFFSSLSRFVGYSDAKCAFVDAVVF